MKSDEPFNPDVKSADPPVELKFRLAQIEDREAVTALMAERNPSTDPSDLFRTTDREISLNSTDPRYRLYVAELHGQVIGLCRYYHSEGLPKEKLRFAAPHGWYCMGLLVDKRMRRQGVARFLFQQRLNSLKAQGAKEAYSFVESENLASVAMHQAFGFEEVGKGAGFLHIQFDRIGILYRMTV